MKIKSLAAPILATIVAGAVSCVTEREAAANSYPPSSSKQVKSMASGGTKEAKSAEVKAPVPGNSKKSDAPDKIQPTFQDQFAREVAKAGPKSEGWALFSDSPMSYPGQRWIIKTNDPTKDSITLCVIQQEDKECTRRDLSKQEFKDIEPTLKRADTLSHLLPTSFDGTSYEYLHAKNSVPVTTRVVFITSAKPFPPEYLTLIKAFKGLDKAK